MSSTNRIRAPRLTVPVRPRVLRRWLLLAGFGAMPAAAVDRRSVRVITEWTPVAPPQPDVIRPGRHRGAGRSNRWCYRGRHRVNRFSTRVEDLKPKDALPQYYTFNARLYLGHGIDVGPDETVVLTAPVPPGIATLPTLCSTEGAIAR